MLKTHQTTAFVTRDLIWGGRGLLAEKAKADDVHQYVSPAAHTVEPPSVLGAFVKDSVPVRVHPILVREH